MLASNKQLAVALAAWMLCAVVRSSHAFLNRPASAASGSFGLGRQTCQSSQTTVTRTRLYLFDLLKAGKTALVRQLAGEYDSDAVSEMIGIRICGQVLEVVVWISLLVFWPNRFGLDSMASLKIALYSS
jgi:hypothetical protein